jgi:hypothetical protein
MSEELCQSFGQVRTDQSNQAKKSCNPRILMPVPGLSPLGLRRPRTSENQFAGI